MAKQLNVDVNLNTAQAEAKLKNLQNLLSQAITSSSKSSTGGLTQEIVSATKAASDLKVMLGQAMNPNTGNLDLSRFSQQLSKSKTSLNDYAKSLTKLGPQGQQAFMSLTKSIVSAEVPMRESGKLLNELGTTFKNTLRWQATSSVIHNIVGGIQSAMSYARGLDSSLNSIRIVTGLSADEMSKFAKSANESAKALSASTLDYTDAALIYYQQGIRDQKQIKERTDATIKMANVTGDSAAKVSNQLTAIWNNFAKGGDNIEYYADVITALGAATASSSAEISAGLSKFASIAEETGLSYEYATSSLATIVATTRQSADVVGTALKTIFGRVQSLNLGETLDDGTTLGKYSKALSQVGIDIKDQNGELKNMDTILDEMGSKWKNLNRDQRVAMAQAVAGARQYNQLMALMENYDFFKENVAIAKGSEGELTKQAEIYAESWDAAKTRVRAAAQGIFDSLISDKFFIGLNDGLATALDGLGRFIDALGGIPGTLGLVGSIITKVFSQQIGQSLERSIQSFKVFTGVARVEANSVRDQAITAAKTFTPDETAPKSLQMQSSSLQQQLVLANQYQQKMEAIAKAGGQVAASDKQRIASLMQIVELTQEAAIAAQQQVEASEMAQNQMNANILRNTIANEIKKGASIENAREIAASRMKDIGKSQQQLEAGYLAQSGLTRLKDNNFNLTSSQLSGLTRIILNRQAADNTERIKYQRMGNAGEAAIYTNNIKNRIDALNLLRSGEYQKTNEQYQTTQKKLRNFKGSDADKAKLEAEAANLEAALKNMATKIQNAIKDSANKIKDANFDIEQAENAIIQDLVDESESTRNKVLEDVEQRAKSKVNAEDLKNQGDAYLDETAEAIENLNKESFSGLTTGLSTAMSGVANLAMGFSSLKSGIEAINDESLSFGDKLMQVGMSFGMAIPMITSGLGSMVTGFKGLKMHGTSLISQALLANTAAGFGQSSGYLAAIAGGTGAEFAGSVGVRKSLSGFMNQRSFDRAVLKALKRNPGDAVAAFNAGQTALYARGGSQAMMNNAAGLERAKQLQAGTAGKGVGAVAAGGLSMPQVAGIIAALAALAVLVAKVKKELYDASLEGQLEKAAAEGQQLTSALEEAKSAAEGLKSAFDSYHGIADTLSKCTTGTQEWSEALRENNNEVLSLMSQYPELAKIQGAIQKNADGSLSISKQAEQEMNTIAQNRIDTLSWAKLANAETQQMLKDQLDIQAKGREMAQLMESGKDSGYWSQGEYKKDVKTSAFDTDLFGAFYKTGTEWGISDLHPYEKTHETSVGVNQLANEALIKNWGDLQALSGQELTTALNDVFTKNNLGISSDDLAKYSAAVESSTYRDELTKLYNQQKAAQDAFETSQIGIISNKLASEGILDNDSKTRDLVSNIFGKQLDERTKTAVEEDKQKYTGSKSERQRLAEEYVAAMGGDINSISFNNSGELSYLDSQGSKVEGITAAMVASVTGAASALEELAGAASSAASAFKEIPMTEGGDAIRDFLTNGDLTKTSTKGLRDIFGLQLEGTAFSEDALVKSLISSSGGMENVKALAEAVGKTDEEYLTELATSAVEAKQWYNSDERKKAMAQIHSTTGADEWRLEDYSRADLEARQRYENSKIDRGPVKTLQELQTAAEAAGDAQEYLNRTWHDGAHLTGDQMAGLKGIIQDAGEYALVIDESTGKVRDASLLTDMLNKSIRDVGVESVRAQQPLYEQLNSLYSDLEKNANFDLDTSRQESILQEIDLIQQEIAKYKELSLVAAGAMQAYDKIAEGKEYDEAHDYTDELEGALGSIYSHIEKDSNGNYDWSTLQAGSHEVQAAMAALLPQDILEETNREGITAQQYLRDMYGDGKTGGRYRDKDGNITKTNVDNFLKDAMGQVSAWGDYSGFIQEGDLEEAYKTGKFNFLQKGEQGAIVDQMSIKEAASSMHMTESAFVSMISAMDKYNTSGHSFFENFNTEGSEFTIQLQKQTEQVKSAAEQVLQAKQKLNENPSDKTAQENYRQSLEEEKNAILAARKTQREGALEGAQYKALQAQLEVETDEDKITEILNQMHELEEHGDIEIKVSFATDENITNGLIDDFKNKFGEGWESAQGYVEHSSQEWANSVAQTIAGAEDSAKVYADTLGKIFKDTKFEDLPKNIQKAFEGAGIDSKTFESWGAEVEEALTPDEPLKVEVDKEEITSAVQDAVKEAEGSIEPIKIPAEVVDESGNPIKDSKSTTKDDKGGTSGEKGQKQVQQQQQIQASEPVKITADISDVQAKLETVNSLISSISSPPPLTISSNLTNVADQAATLSGVLHTLAGAVPVITINTNAAQVGGQIQQLKTKALQLNGIKPKISISSNASAVLGTVTSLKTAISTLPSTKTINISVNVTGDEVPKVSGAFGTARAYGNAFEKGKWGTGTGSISALVGELGQELVVDPATGRFYTVGDAGAEFTVLPKNAIVFNHKQTEQLLKYRKINSRGQAMAEGNTNQVKGLAFAAGTDEPIQYQEKMLTIIRNEVDLFKEIEFSLKQINHELKDVQRNIGRLAGRDAFVNIEKTIQKLNELYKENLHARDYAVEKNKIDKQTLNSVLIQWEQQKEHATSTAGERKFNTERAEQVQDAFKFLETYGKLSSDAYKRDENGVVTDYDKYEIDLALKRMTQNAEITYNNAVKSETLTQQQQVEAENAYKYIMGAVDAIGTAFQNEQDTAEKIIEYTETAQDNLEEMHDLEMQRIKEEFELRKQLTENDLKRLELISKRLDNSFFKRAEKLSYMFDSEHMFEPTDWAKNQTHTELGDRIKEYHAAIKQFEQAEIDLKKAQAERGYADPHAITEQAFMDLSQASMDELADFEDYLIDLINTMRTYFADTLSQASDELEKYTDQMGHYVSVLDHMSNLMDLLGRKFDFDSKETIIRGQMNNLKNDLDIQTQWYDELHENRLKAEEHLASMKDQYSKEQYEYEYNNYVLPSIQAEQEAEEKKYKSAEAYLEKLEALYQNAFDRINAEWEKLGTQGQGWDYLTDAMSRAKSIQDEYLTTTNKLYETNTLMRKVQNDINKTDSKISKEKFVNFSKEIEAAQENDKLAKSSMEILKARYELLQAEIALEDAKNAKSTVRLQRDSEGNYGYVYTADQDDINDKEQNFADKQNDLYNLVLGYQNDYQEKTMQAMQEFQQKWMDLEQQRKEGIIASDEDLHAKQEELYKYYSDLMLAYGISLNESQVILEQVAAEGVSEAWTKSWEERRGNLDDFKEFANVAHNELNGYLTEINDVRNEVVKDAKLGMDDVNKKVGELTTKSNVLKDTIKKDVIPTLSDEIEKVGKVTEAFDEQYDHLGDLIDQVHNYLNVMGQAQVNLVGKEYQNDAHIPDYSTAMAKEYFKSGGKISDTYRIMEGERHDKSLNKGRSFWSQSNDEERRENEVAYKYQDRIKAAGLDPESFFTNITAGINRNGDWNKFDSYSDEELLKFGGVTLASGGYTGEWGSEGKLAILHEKELVLNKDDTSNFLQALELAKQNFELMTQTRNLQSLYEQKMISSIAGLNTVAFTNQNQDTLQQEVTIHAEFPNVQEHSEIEKAFDNLVNRAAQYAARDHWVDNYNAMLTSSTSL